MAWDFTTQSGGIWIVWPYGTGVLGRLLAPRLADRLDGRRPPI